MHHVLCCCSTIFKQLKEYNKPLLNVFANNSMSIITGVMSATSAAEGFWSHFSRKLAELLGDMFLPGNTIEKATAC